MGNKFPWVGTELRKSYITLSVRAGYKFLTESGDSPLIRIIPQQYAEEVEEENWFP